MRNTFARAIGSTGFALAALSSAIIMSPGCVDRDAITREVTLTDDGVIITIDSDDPDAVEMIQERAAEHADRPRPDDAPPVETTVENTATGVIITIVGGTDEAIARIQEHATREPGERREGGREGHGRRPGGEGERLEGVERTVTETATGIEISLES